MRKSDPFHRKPKQKSEPATDVPGDAPQALDSVAEPSIPSHSNTPQMAQGGLERALDVEVYPISVSKSPI